MKTTISSPPISVVTSAVTSATSSDTHATSSRGDVWPKRLLFAAAAWNILGGAVSLFDPAQHFTQMYNSVLSLEDPLQLFFFRCTWINVIAWGVGYLIAAFVPRARTAVLAAGGAGKCIYAATCWSLFASGVGKPGLLVSAAFDLVFALLFAVVLFAPSDSARRQSVTSQSSRRIP